jgi:hypothetical protein
MAVESMDRTRVVVWYAMWATVCAALACVLVAFAHTWFFSYHVGRSGLVQTLVDDLETSLAIAAGQGAVALVTGSVLAGFGRVLDKTVLLGLCIGLFDFVLNFLQMVVPPMEFGWAPDLIILAVAAAAITAAGGVKASAA